jgi:hypothetical protein
MTANQPGLTYTAHGLTFSILGLIENLLREEEKHEAYFAIFDQIKAGLERYELARQREQRRPNPVEFSEN